MSMKKIVITGISRGIGKALAKSFLKGGFFVIGTSTSGKIDFEDENLEVHKLSIDERDSVRDFVEIIGDRKILGLINNAAILLEDTQETKVDFEKLHKTFNVNLFGPVNLTENLIDKFEKGSKIINISSNWGSFSDPGFTEFQPHYKMSKAALNMYTKLLAERLKAQNINVSAFDPGWVKTDMGGMHAVSDPGEVAEKILKNFISDNETGKFWKGSFERDW